MRKGQDRKVKIAEFGSALTADYIGRISCLGMLGLGFIFLNPFISSASAITSEELEGGSLASSISIAFAPASGNTTLSPTAVSGASGLISVLANVGVTNSGGYSVYLGSSSPNLVGKQNNSVVIPGVSGEVSFDNLQNNTWGYTAAEGAAIPENATYKAISQGQGELIFANNNSRLKNESKTFALGFAAKITNDIPADTYENQVTLSVLSSPYQLTLLDIDNMQDMTSAICENTSGLATKQLKDVRDGKNYWVAKLADNNCWMTQNLALDLGDEWPDADLSDYDVANTEYKPVSTADKIDSSTLEFYNTSTRSWSANEYLLLDPESSVACGIASNDLADCEARFVSVVDKSSSDNANFYADYGVTLRGDYYDAHYLVGNYYQWNTATAGTGGTIVDGQAAGSICPKGWKLPTGATTANGSFGGLLFAANLWNNVNELTGSGYSFVRGGDIVPNDTLLQGAGNRGLYWSSTPNANVAQAHTFSFGGVDAVDVFGYPHRRSGVSVRCVAR